jgi:hypothetical protein
MSRPLVSILPSETPDEAAFIGQKSEPFTLHDTLTIADAAMVYGDRHPRPCFWFGGNLSPSPLNLRQLAAIDEIEKLIGKGAVKNYGDDPRELETWEKCWAVYCTLVDAVERGSLPPAKPVYLTDRRINPVLTEIPLSALLDLARQRGDADDIVSSLLTWYEPARFELPSGFDSAKPSRPQPRETKLSAVQRHIAQTYPSGIPAGVTDKQIARDTRTSERTVRRARRLGQPS